MKKWEAILLSIIIFSGCKKPYNPPAITAPGTYLVVEGAIDAGSDSTIITISRTVKLSSTSAANPVQHAIVTVESDQNAVYPLNETAKGRYVAAGLNLDNTRKYRLSIKTTNNEQYYSNYESVLNSPPIDSLYYTIATNGINIYTNTHDPANTVKYYRWDYQETWIYHSAFNSYFYSNGDTVLIRPANNQVYTCWGSDTSSNVLLASTFNLTNDVADNNPIAFVASTSYKLEIEYSILVKQYALTSDAYNFWLNLKKNTEQLGSIFDAQPSQINGNIYCQTNPAEPVIGYISVGSVSSQRIFIRSQQLPGWAAADPYSECALDTELYAVYPYRNDSTYVINEVNITINYNSGDFSKNLGGPLIPVGAIGGSLYQPIAGFSAATPICVDCTLRGTNVEPNFWK